MARQGGGSSAGQCCGTLLGLVFSPAVGFATLGSSAQLDSLGYFNRLSLVLTTFSFECFLRRLVF